VAGIRRDAPGLLLGVRLSAFDLLPYQPGAGHVGVPAAWQGEYRYGFGVEAKDPAFSYDLKEAHAFLSLLEELNIPLVCVTAGSPYYNPHIQRPALFPPCDGYLPPEDPLVGVARQIEATAQLKALHPKLCVVGSAYTYLQEYIALVAQYQVRHCRTDFVGLGRMVLSYPQLPADVLAGRPLERRQLCRTFSDCTTAPRNGLVSGCYPLDSCYKALPEAAKLEAAKSATK
jgi:2,4-dienoyl-CoA reductase-like NADH-dependent reductase (Old Yellow Enzyme family)